MSEYSQSQKPLYETVLVALENSARDETILSHIEPLVKLCGSRILLVHVADGWAARNFHQLNLAESQEMRDDRAYLEKLGQRFRDDGIECETVLLMGEPAKEIIALVKSRDIDLLAMTTHGHRLFADILLGTTVDKVRHEVEIPVLLLKAARA